jgi:glutaredoxin 3
MKNILIYTKKPCPYCEHAKTLLKQKGLAYEEKLLTSPDEMIALKKKTGWMTFPQIFIGDKLIGGFDDLSALNQSGELDKMLELK